MYEGVLHRVSCFITLEEDKSAYVAKDNEMKSLVTAKAVGAYHESHQHSKERKKMRGSNEGPFSFCAHPLLSLSSLLFSPSKSCHPLLFGNGVIAHFSSRLDPSPTHLLKKSSPTSPLELIHGPLLSFKNHH
ncbi:hypothetical protein YC2023_059344 [Brassica napus]